MVSYALIGLLFCLAFVNAEVEDLQPLVKSSEDTLHKAKTHVEHMLNLNPVPNHEKIPPIVKNETDHLAYEIKKLATHLPEKFGTGEHKPEIKDAVTNAVTHLNEAAASLEHVGTDLKGDNTKYFEAAEKTHHEIQSILQAGHCNDIAPLLKDALNELTHDVNNYQWGIHEVIGSHEGGADHTGHVGHGEAGHDHHHVHHHHGASSSEESSEEKSH